MKRILSALSIVFLIVSCDNGKAKLESQLKDSHQTIDSLRKEWASISKELERTKKETIVQLENYLQLEAECK